MTSKPRAGSFPAAMPADDIRAEGARLAGAAVTAGMHMRLMGGLAIWLTSPTVRRPPYERDYLDLDFAAWSRESMAVSPFFESSGYRPDKLFNALHGARRLKFVHSEGLWTIDVIFDELRMSHLIDLRGRLAGAGPTLDLADLLLTKLQIWEINLKDVGDAVCLLTDHELSAAGSRPTPGAIDVARITALCSADWGLAHTVERNLGKVIELARAAPPLDGAFDPVTQAATLRSAIEAVPKTLGWRARALVGERVRWYETPEEIRGQPARATATRVDPAPGRDR